MTQWRKSSYSQGTADCTEVSMEGVTVRVRDSKNPTGTPLTLPSRSFGLFIDVVTAEQTQE